MATTDQKAESRRRMRRDKALVVREAERIGLDGMPMAQTARKALPGVRVFGRKWGWHAKELTEAVQLYHGWPVTGRLNAGQRAYLERPVRERAALKAVEAAEARWHERGEDGAPSRANRVPELADLARALGLSDWYQKMGWAWCAFFVHLMALAEGSSTAKAGLRGAYNALWTVSILAAARRGEHGLRLLERPEQWRLGDWLEFDFPGGEEVDHIGIALGRVGEGGYGHPAKAGWIVTVEGNTSPDDGGSQSDGGGVYIRHRPASSIRAGVRYR